MAAATIRSISAWPVIAATYTKRPNLSSIDPQTQANVTLFHRSSSTLGWTISRYEERMILGLAPTGRATVRLLNVNAKHRLKLRLDSSLEGELPAVKADHQEMAHAIFSKRLALLGGSLWVTA